jgi:dihydroorotase
MPLPAVIALLSTRPAQALNLKNCGTLTIGSSADVVLIDPAAKWTFRAADSRSKSKNTPFDGTEIQGRIHATIGEGRVTFRR